MAKDFLGQEVEIGDQVVFMAVGYRNLKVGKVTRISSSKFTIICDNKNFYQRHDQVTLLPEPPKAEPLTYAKPQFITFTGVDDRTNLETLKQVSNFWPVEWGVLVSPTNRDARFPSQQTVRELLQTGLPCSLHCCGSHSKKIQNGNPPNFSLFGIPNFDRVQLNGKIYDPIELSTLADTLNATIIVQKKEFDKDIYRCSQLFDLSGGRGDFPESFPEHPGFFVGYAGGINPDNVLDAIKKINVPIGASYWLDMETGVRTDGWFDLDKVANVCRKVFE